MSFTLAPEFSSGKLQRVGSTWKLSFDDGHCGKVSTEFFIAWKLYCFD